MSNKSMKILEALNDIDDKFITENISNKKINTFNEKVKEKANTNRVKSKVIYQPVFVVILIIACIAIITISKKENNSLIIAQNNNETINKPILNDNIIFNTIDKLSLADIAGKWVDSDLSSEIDFVNKIKVPSNFKLSREGKIYENENDKDTNFSKLWQYSLIYMSGNIGDKDNSPEFIEITFTKEDHILQCMPPDENSFLMSTINGYKVGLYNYQNKKEAFFEYEGYKFYIEAQISEEDFVTLIKSILK